MKYHYRLFCCLLCMILAPSISLGDEITLLADPWCPYTCASQSDRPGYMIEIAQRIFSKSGHSVKYINLDWDTAIAEAEGGKYNAIVGAYKEDAPGFIFPEKSFGMSGNVFFARKDSKWQYTGLDSLAKIRIGTVKGYSYGEVLDPIIEEKNKAGEIVEAEGMAPLDSLVEKLLNGEVDVIIEDLLVLSNYFLNNKKHGFGAVKKAGQQGEMEAVYIAFSPANPKSSEYAEILSKGLPELRKSGELVDILKKYNIKDWE